MTGLLIAFAVGFVSGVVALAAGLSWLVGAWKRSDARRAGS